MSLPRPLMRVITIVITLVLASLVPAMLGLSAARGDVPRDRRAAARADAFRYAAGASLPQYLSRFRALWLAHSASLGEQADARVPALGVDDFVSCRRTAVPQPFPGGDARELVGFVLRHNLAPAPGSQASRHLGPIVVALCGADGQADYEGREQLVRQAEAAARLAAIRRYGRQPMTSGRLARRSPRASAANLSRGWSDRLQTAPRPGQYAPPTASSTYRSYRVPGVTTYRYYTIRY